jgi:cytochrome oxidase Cu insertion factor (SCO1/SenC/PrrC family)/thiol-disulfide isomerase/thioredoxin
LSDLAPQELTSAPDGSDGATRRRSLRPVVALCLALLAAVIVVVVAIATGPAGSSGSSQAVDLQTNPDLDPGTALHGHAAAAFTLTNQFGRPVSLDSFRGHVVILAFNDSQCTTVCPLTTTAMVEAKSMLGSAGSGVELLGIDANPTATAVKWVRAYSQVHGMLHQWQFLTGSLPELRRVWHAYGIEVKIEAGQIDHTPAVYMIDSRGQEAEIYETQMAYRSVGQQAQIFAREASRLLPGHPRVRSSLSYQTLSSVGPAAHSKLPAASGGQVSLGPDGSPRLYVFFASWLTETLPLAADLDSLRTYEAIAAKRGLPRVTAVDEGSVEPSPAALPLFLRTLRSPLSFPVAVDGSGRVADGYLVQDQPWFVLASSSGRILWYWDASTNGWPSPSALLEHVTAALSSPPSVKPPPVREVPRLLAGSPPLLAAIHSQAGELLGSENQLLQRVHALRGYPIVVDAWASWCENCQQEYPLFASASVRYGRQVAFLGVDALDYGPSYGRGFLASHPLSYPSYQSPSGELPGLAGIYGLPATIFIDRQGKVTETIDGIFDSQGELDGDIETYAMGE